VKKILGTLSTQSRIANEINSLNKRKHKWRRQMAAIPAMFAVCGMQNVGPAATNPAAQFVQATGIREPEDLLNFSEDDMTSIVKAYNQRDEFTSVPMLVCKNLEALMYFAKYQWHHQREITRNWTPAAMIQIKAIIQQVKAAKADQICGNTVLF
jgi:hypothetical protein